jgi:hypothetical protein
MQPDNLVTKHMDVLRELSDNGYAVIIWTPEELGDDVSPEEMEDYLISEGSEYINARSVKVDVHDHVYDEWLHHEHIPEFIRKQAE